jgi:hypothetical protein
VLNKPEPAHTIKYIRKGAGGGWQMAYNGNANEMCHFFWDMPKTSSIQKARGGAR